VETALIVVAIFAALAGAFSLHNAFLGVGFIAIGCLLAIIARMVQGEAHHGARIPPEVVRPHENWIAR
jgi:hypothetical protein